ncbi:MAG: hypothetical protein V8S81_03055 [Oscillospiraceae bacterium]
MNENKEFEHEIDPDLLAEIEEWEKADHDEPAEYYFSNLDPYLKPQASAAQSSPAQLLL